MSLSEFWASLEQQAVPHIRAEVEKRGWVLADTGSAKWHAHRKNIVWDESGDGPISPTVTALSGSDVLARIDEIERRIRKSPAGIEILFRRVTEDSEVVS